MLRETAGDLRKALRAKTDAFRARRSAPPENPLRAYFHENPGRVISKWMHDFDICDRHVAAFRGKDVNAVEIGVSHRGSLQMWKQYSGPKADITGVDIEPRCGELPEHRIDIVIGDQEDREFLRGVAQQFGKIDVLIEAGGRTAAQQINTSEEFWPPTREGGVFPMEDLHSCHWEKYNGGHKRPGTFIEYAKDLIDQEHAWPSREGESSKVDKCARPIRGMRVYDSIIGFDQGRVERPTRLRTGKPSF